MLKAPGVLRSVLLETGYMSSPNDFDLLSSDYCWLRLAVGVTHAIETPFVRETAGMSTVSR